MAFIGAGIQAVKGVIETILNKKKLKTLEELDKKELFELIPKEKHLTSKILLKQTEHQRLILNNAKKDKIFKVEKEILELMKENIKEKQEKLKKEKATQLDIANLLLSIQKLSKETNEEIHSFKNKIDKQQTKFMAKCNKRDLIFLIYNIILTITLIYIIAT